MSTKEERFGASRDLVEFLSKFSQVIGKQLVGVRELIEQAVGEVMAGVNEISQTTSSEATAATQILEKTYFDPDAKTSELVEAIQSSVDHLVDEAAHDADAAGQTDKLVDAHLRRFGGQFSKHMEALSTFDQEISHLLLKMVGALSTDDVIRQKLEHTLSSIQALQIGLSYVLLDFNRRFTIAEVQLLQRDILSYTYDLYTSEDEKRNFAKIFGKAPDDKEGPRNRFANS